MWCGMEVISYCISVHKQVVEGSNFEFPETAAASNHVSKEEILKLTPNLPYAASPFLLLLKKTSNALQIR